MNEIVFRGLKRAFLVSAAFGIAATFSTGLRTVLLDVYLLAMGGVLLLALVRTTRAHAPPGGASNFDGVLATMRRPPPDSGAPVLARDLDLSTVTAFHLHIRLRPLLREIAAHRLRARYGVDLDVEPGRARELVGARAWELVRPLRPPPADRLAPGPPVSYLREVVAELESI
jgi:hypothetical protein